MGSVWHGRARVRAGERMLWTVYTHSARFYDAIYAFRDYRAEVEGMLQKIDAHRPGARSLLDVACGTGKHLEHFKARFDAQGLDLSEELLAVARERNPELALHRGDMRSFELGERFDVLTCLFSAIGHLASVDELRCTARTFARHLHPGGLALIEPWFTPEQWRPGGPHSLFVDEPDLKIARINLSEVRGRLSVMELHYLVGMPGGVHHFVERLEAYLFTHQEYLSAFEEVGFTVEYDPEGPVGRGLYLALSG